MNIWFAKAVVLLANIVLVAIRAPHGQRSRSVPVATSWRGSVEAGLLAFAWIAFFVPVLWVVTPWFAFADYPLHVAPLAAGAVLMALGLWGFHRSHVDLGTNWSITLEVREAHELVTRGVYARVPHPMYTSLLVFSAGQALALPNWVAGPIYGVAMIAMIALRLGREEAMMREAFGARYDRYAAKTGTLWPRLSLPSARDDDDERTAD